MNDCDLDRARHVTSQARASSYFRLPRVTSKRTTVGESPNSDHHEGSANDFQKWFEKRCFAVRKMGIKIGNKMYLTILEERPPVHENGKLKPHPTNALSGFRYPVAEHRGRSIRIFAYQGCQIVFDVTTGSSKSRRRNLTVRLVDKHFIFFVRQ